MRLRRVGTGDLIRIDGDPSLWQIIGKRGKRIDVALMRGARVRRRTSSYQVVEAWRRVRRDE